MAVEKPRTGDGVGPSATAHAGAPPRRNSTGEAGHGEDRATAAASPASSELVIITGLSGSGKGSVLKAFEDLGYYSVDNLPIDLIPKFAELTRDSPTIRYAALVVDIREGEELKRVSRHLRHDPARDPHPAAFSGGRR